MQSRDLILFTNNYPFSIGEEYLKEELDILSTRFKKIYIIPAEVKGERKLTPKNCEVVKYKYPNKRVKASILIKNIGVLLSILISEYLSNLNKGISILLIKKNTILLVNQLYRLYALNDIWKEKYVYYSYWTNEWATLLAIAKKKKKIESFICRIHGYDLFEERFPNNYIPFRTLQFGQANKIIAISKMGQKYLSERYKYFKEKFDFCYLGVQKSQPPKSIKKRDTIHLVSCSRMDNNKRVELIAEALIYINTKIHWTHIGDGEKRKHIENLTQHFKPNITFELKGNISNAEVRKFYSNNEVDIFINLSLQEGLPVSIMEAISFGIPVIATNVGGVAEIVNKTTGILLPHNVEHYHIIKSIEKIIELKDQKQLISDEIINFQLENFNSSKNYTQFFKKHLRHL